MVMGDFSRRTVQYIKRHDGVELMCGSVAPAYLHGSKNATLAYIDVDKGVWFVVLLKQL